MRGSFEPLHQLFIDNQNDHGRAGYHVITPLRLAHSGRRILVNRGWVPMGNARGPFAAGPGLYVLDPEVRVILRYAPGFDPFGVLEGLKRLLKYSWLG